MTRPLFSVFLCDDGKRVWCNSDSNFYGGRFRAFLTYFPSISHLFLHYFPKNFPFPNYFPVISRLFHSYFSFLNNFSLISQIFPNYFSFPDDASHFSVTLPNYFSVISQLFPSESPDISAIASWSCSCSTRTDCWLSWTKSSFYFSVSEMGSSLKSKLKRFLIRNRHRVFPRVILSYKKRPRFRHLALLNISNITVAITARTTAKTAKLLQVHSVVLLLFMHYK